MGQIRVLTRSLQPRGRHCALASHAIERGRCRRTVATSAVVLKSHEATLGNRIAQIHIRA